MQYSDTLYYTVERRFKNLSYNNPGTHFNKANENKFWRRNLDDTVTFLTRLQARKL